MPLPRPRHIAERVTRSPALLALILGAVAACGFAPLHLWPLTLVALAGWMLLIHRAPTLRTALWQGWLFGLGHFTINNNWFQHAFDFQDKMPPVLGYFASVALALYLGIFPMAAAGIAWRARRTDTGPDAPFVLVFAAAWIATEYLRATLLTGYAWDPLAVLWLPVIGVARISALVGTYALSGLTIVAAGALLLAVRRHWTLPAIAAATFALAAASAPFTHAPPPAPGTPRIRVVQPNIGNDLRTADAGDYTLDALIAGSGRPGAIPRLIVWPEGLLQQLLENGYPAYVYDRRWPVDTRRRIASILGPRDMVMTNATTLTFDARGDIDGAGNSVLAITPEARIAGRYDKAHLVPFGEYLPWSSLLTPLGLARLVPGDIDFVPGRGPASLDWPAYGAIGIQVCYEIIFSGEVVDRAHRPRLIFNPSNDAWYGRWGPPQFLAQAQLRAIEEGLPVVRATPTGISAIIAADGRVVARIPHETAGAVEAPIPPALPPTPFARLGNLLAALVAIALFAIAVAIRRRGR